MHVSDFQFLVNHVYLDDDDGFHYVTTRVGISRGFIVAYRAPLMEGGLWLGTEEPKPIHAREVEKMLSAYLSTHTPALFIDGALTHVSVTTPAAGMAAPTASSGSDQPRGTRPPTAAAGPPQG